LPSVGISLTIEKFTFTRNELTRLYIDSYIELKLLELLKILSLIAFDLSLLDFLSFSFDA